MTAFSCEHLGFGEAVAAHVSGNTRCDDGDTPIITRLLVQFASAHCPVLAVAGAVENTLELGLLICTDLILATVWTPVGMAACLQILQFYAFKFRLVAVHLSAGEIDETVAVVLFRSDAEAGVPASNCHVMVRNTYPSITALVVR